MTSRPKAGLEGLHATDTLRVCVGRGMIVHPGTGKAGPVEEVLDMLVRESETTYAIVTLSLHPNVRFLLPPA